MADRLFAAFSKRVGVANIREWEEQHAAFEEEVAARKAELLQQVDLRRFLNTSESNSNT